MSELNLIDDYPAQIYTTLNSSASLDSIVSMQLSLEVQAHVRAESCETLGNPKDCTLPGFSLRGIFQARILEWVAISYSGHLPSPGIDRASLALPALAGRFLTTAPPEKIKKDNISWLIRIIPEIQRYPPV